MEKWDFDLMQLWRVYLLCATAYTIVLSGCVLCLNEEGQLLLNWKQDSLEDPDDSLSNWNASDTTPCFWNGVKCTQGSVSGLDFSPIPFCNLVGDIQALTFAKFANLTILNVGNTSLNGNFPEDIVNCSKLVYLNLSWTYISGEVPANINNLQHLQVLDVTYAEMEGTVVTRFDELQDLRVLRLAWNNFEGQMPESIPSLTKLQELTLSGNNWNGSLPLGFFTIPNLKVLWLGSDLDVLDMVPWPNFSLWESLEDLRLEGVKFPQALFPTGALQLIKLRTLHLERCNIMGPIPSLSSLTHLEDLDLGNNTLTGHIPDMFGSMPNLTVLWIFQNQLTGPLPATLLQCRKLAQLIAFTNGLNGDFAGVANLRDSLNWLDLGDNNFSGEIPASLGNLTLLISLALSGNNLTGEIPPSLGNLSLVTNLDLSGNNLSGKILPEIANWEGLSQLRLFDNQLTGEIPYELGRKSLLERVDLGSNRLEGPIPPYLCWGNNVTLQFLGLWENKLTGTIPETYGNCTNLGVVRFDGNMLEGPVPAGLWGGANLVRMQLNGNNLSGGIDASIGNAKSLSILYLQDNIFSGTVPAEIGQTSLVKFQANSNELSGTLTPLLGNLSGLTELTLGANSFSGSIPGSLGNCTELVQLDLAMNHLEGAIPDALANLNKLSTLDLSENNLTGPIPRGLFDLLTLQTLNVAFNNLSGVIPHQGNGPVFVTVNFTGNPYLCVEGSCGTNTSSVVNSASEGGKREAWPVVVGVFCAVALGLFIVSVLVYRKCWGDSRRLLHTHAEEDLWTLTSFTERIYEGNEVTALDEENVIGAGGSGKVYKVTVSSGETVAVKKVWSVMKEESGKDHGFGTEVRTLANIRHEHIVRLLCCCTKQDSNLLVYEYMAKGSLGDLLHSTKAETLPWEIRYKIALGAAMGLEFLHHDCTPQILHRDIKSNNILVDLEYEAYLTDFGIAKVVETAASHTLSTIAGSLGYMAPGDMLQSLKTVLAVVVTFTSATFGGVLTALVSRCKGIVSAEYNFSTRVSEKIDIYSFGVVLLELVTGKRAIDPTIYGEHGANLVQWVNDRVQTQEGVYEILDGCCKMSSQEDMIAFLQIAMMCTSFMPGNRPSMRDVVALLKNIAPKTGMNLDGNKDGGAEEGCHNEDVLLQK